MTVPKRPTRNAPRHPGFFLRHVNKRLAQASQPPQIVPTATVGTINK